MEQKGTVLLADKRRVRLYERGGNKNWRALTTRGRWEKRGKTDLRTQTSLVLQSERKKEELIEALNGDEGAEIRVLKTVRAPR